MRIGDRRGYDAVVVGGGITGLTAAWALRDRGVVLLDDAVDAGLREWIERKKASFPDSDV